MWISAANAIPGTESWGRGGGGWVGNGHQCCMKSIAAADLQLNLQKGREKDDWAAGVSQAYCLEAFEPSGTYLASLSA